MVLSDRIPRANFEELPGSKKFVQFYVDDREPYLRVGTIGHQRIILSFVEECRREGQPIVDSYGFETKMLNARREGIHPVVPLTFGRYTAVGFGSIYVIDKSRVVVKGDADPEILDFCGKSDDYDLGPNREHLKKLSVYLPDLEFRMHKKSLNE